MDEFQCTFLGVDVDNHADVAYGLAAGASAEEHQVAYLDIIHIAYACALSALHARGGAERIAEVAVDIGGEARAVKYLGALAAVYVAATEIFLGVAYEFVFQRGVEEGCVEVVEVGGVVVILAEKLERSHREYVGCHRVKVVDSLRALKGGCGVAVGIGVGGEGVRGVAEKLSGEGE